ncbi:MAG: ABC transporter substrate-binding protein [Firmicutes bacterium]|nr:ABC transporter substrate-binding protein [Bacillota bacterium]
MRFKWIPLPLTLALVGILLAGCSGQTPTSSPPAPGGTQPSSQLQTTGSDLPPLKHSVTVKIAEDGAPSGAGFYIAEAKGYFRAYGINIQWVTFSNSEDMLPAVAADQVDLAGGISSASLFNAVAQGIDVKAIADKGHDLKNRSYFTLVIRKQLAGKVKTYSDLKGLTCAISGRDSVDQYMLDKALGAGGLTEKDVHVVVIDDFGQMLAALANGSVDVAMEIEPFIAQGEAQGISVRFLDTTQYLEDAQCAIVLASPAFVQKRDVAERFMLAYLKGIRDYNAAFVTGNKDRAAITRILMQYTPLKDPAIWNRAAPTGLDPDGNINIANLQMQYEYYKQGGNVKGNVDLHQVVDLSLAQQAAKLLGPAS